MEAIDINILFIGNNKMKNNCIYKRGEKCLQKVLPNCLFFKKDSCFYDPCKNTIVSYRLASKVRRDEKRMTQFDRSYY